MDDIVYEFVRFISRDDLLYMDYRMALSDYTERLPFRYVLLINLSGQYEMQKDLLTKAKAVHLKNCDTVNAIAETLSILRYSRVIDLSGCSIVELPAIIGQLKHLRYLNVSGSRIRVLLGEMCCLQDLESLNIAETCIEMLPIFIGIFHEPKYFNLRGCDKLQSLPSALGDLKRLEHLNLSCCTGICDLPISLCELKELNFLDLSGCSNLEELPHPFGNLELLRYLSLAGCARLKKLPESLDNIRYLVYFNLECCCGLQQLLEGTRRRCKSDLTGCGPLKSLDMPRTHAAYNETYQPPQQKEQGLMYCRESRCPGPAEP